MRRFIVKLKKLLYDDPSPKRITLALSIGTFFAFSPLLGAMTWLAMGFAWIFRTQPLLAAVWLNIINNPWTTLPIILLNYIVGTWAAQHLLRVDLSLYNPFFMAWITKKIGPTLSYYLGIETICFWCFVLGGFIVATLLTIITAPLYFYIAKKLCKRSP